MAGEIRKSIMTEDGRQAEKVVMQEVVGSGEVKTTTEFFVEPKVQKLLSHRVVEHTRPVVHRREIETVNEETGEIETKVETIDPIVKMELREHVVSAQKVPDNYVTFEHLKELLAPRNEVVNMSYAPGAYNPAPVVPGLSMQQVVGERVEKSEKTLTATNVGLLAVILAQLAGVGYIMFYM